LKRGRPPKRLARIKETKRVAEQHLAKQGRPQGVK